MAGTEMCLESETAIAAVQQVPPAARGSPGEAPKARLSKPGMQRDTEPAQVTVTAAEGVAMLLMAQRGLQRAPGASHRGMHRIT